MTRDDRWPFIPFLIARALQFILAFLTLALSAYEVSGYPTAWSAGMSVFIGIFSMIWLSVSFFLLFAGLLLPLIVVVLDAFCLVFYLIAMAGVGSSGVLISGACDVVYYNSIADFSTKIYGPCAAGKAAFAMELLAMISFIATLVLASIILHRNRKDLRGKKYAQGLPALSSNDPDYSTAVEQGVQQQQMEQLQPQPEQPVQQPVEQQYQQQPTPQPMYQQPQLQQYNQQPQQYSQQPPYPQTQYVDPAQQAGFTPVSPPTSPPLEHMQSQNTAGYSTVSSLPTGSINPPTTHVEMPADPMQHHPS